MAEPGPAADETAARDAGETVAAPRSGAADDFAWASEDDENVRDDTRAAPASPELQSWRATWRKAAALFAGGLALAGAIILGFWVLTPPDKGSRPAPSASPSPTGNASPAPRKPATTSTTVAAPPSITSTPDQDNHYVQALNDKGISFANPEAAIYNGKLVCQDIAQGMTVPQIVAAFRASNPSLGNDADAYVTISVHAYCPQNANLVGTTP